MSPEGFFPILWQPASLGEGCVFIKTSEPAHCRRRCGLLRAGAANEPIGAASGGEALGFLICVLCFCEEESLGVCR